jgi:hypothetical protein
VVKKYSLRAKIRKGEAMNGLNQAEKELINTACYGMSQDGRDNFVRWTVLHDCLRSTLKDLVENLKNEGLKEEWAIENVIELTEVTLKRIYSEPTNQD